MTIHEDFYRQLTEEQRKALADNLREFERLKGWNTEKTSAEWRKWTESTALRLQKQEEEKRKKKRN